MGRKYSTAFIDKRIAQIDEMFERNQRDIKLTPRCMMPHESVQPWERRQLSERDIQEIREYHKQFQELAYVRGFWMGWSLREGTPDDTSVQSVGQTPKKVR